MSTGTASMLSSQECCPGLTRPKPTVETLLIMVGLLQAAGQLHTLWELCKLASLPFVLSNRACMTSAAHL